MPRHSPHRHSILCDTPEDATGIMPTPSGLYQETSVIPGSDTESGIGVSQHTSDHGDMTSALILGATFLICLIIASVWVLLALYRQRLSEKSRKIINESIEELVDRMRDNREDVKSRLFWVIAVAVFIGAYLLFTVQYFWLIILVMLVIGLIFSVKRSEVNQALVCIFHGKKIVSIDGRWIVSVPFSELINVSLKMQQYTIAFTGAKALRTKDNLSADVGITFFVRVKQRESDIRKVVDLFGREIESGTIVRKYVDEKLVHIVKSTIAKHALSDLRRDPDALATILIGPARKGLEASGFEVASLTISEFDQSREAVLRPDNIFDAEGIKTVNEARQKLESEQHRIKSEGEFDRSQRDIAANQQLLNLQSTLQQSQIQHDAEISRIKASAEAEITRQRMATETEFARMSVELEEARQLVKNVEAKAECDRRQMNAEFDLSIEKRRYEEIAAAAFTLRASLEQFRIKTDAEVRIESAKAMSQMMSGMNATLYATPDDVTRMMGSFMWGAGIANRIEGFSQGLGRALAPLSPLLSAYGLLTQETGATVKKESESA